MAWRDGHAKEKTTLLAQITASEGSLNKCASACLCP